MLTRAYRSAPTLVWLVGSLLVVELAAAIVGPTVVPASVYLGGYLSDGAIASTKRFVAGGGILLPDSAAGWRNRPDTAAGRWAIDSTGARSTRPVTWERQRPIRVLALGSSTTNGGMGVTNDQTITTFLETDSIEALNFATMLYAADQAYLAWKSRLHALHPDVIVVGLDAAAERPLETVYVPLRSPDEDNIPFVKPRFQLAGDSLTVVRADPAALLSDVPDNPALVEFFETYDSWAWEFNSYRRFGVTPVSGALRAVYTRVRRRIEARRLDTDALDLLARVLNRFEADATAAGSRLVLLLYPDQASMAPGWRSLLPDDYEARRAALADRGIDVVDVRAILRASNEPLWRLFHADGVHFSVLANRLIAEAVRPTVIAAASDSRVHGTTTAAER